MPIALSPSETMRVVLNSDVGKNPCPTFIYRYPTGAVQREMVRVEERVVALTARKEVKAEAVMDEIFKVATMGLVGWENMMDQSVGLEVPFGTTPLEALVSMQEAQELIVKVLSQSLNVQDKKKLDLQLESDTAKSVLPA